MSQLLRRLFPPNGTLRRFAEACLPIVDVLLAPFTFLASAWLGFIRVAGVRHFALARRLFRITGMFPVRDHYYEPLVNPAHLHAPLDKPRTLPGIAWSEDEQLAVLDQFDFNAELLALPRRAGAALTFHYDNPAYGPGDAEMLYNFLRHRKPQRLVEIGSGHSTLLARHALERNRAEGHACRHICIEPFENPWLEKLGVEVIRQRVELASLDVFGQLQAGDFLFIDSSHVIRPQGDVVHEYLRILPSLARGVQVQVHDIFTPYDYPDDIVRRDVCLWNEQYLLEAFLCHNRDFRITWMMHHLARQHWDRVVTKCPVLREHGGRRTGAAFWLEKIA